MSGKGLEKFLSRATTNMMAARRGLPPAGLLAANCLMDAARVAGENGNSDKEERLIRAAARELELDKKVGPEIIRAMRAKKGSPN